MGELDSLAASIFQTYNVKHESPHLHANTFVRVEREGEMKAQWLSHSRERKREREKERARAKERESERKREREQERAREREREREKERESEREERAEDDAGLNSLGGMNDWRYCKAEVNE
jgi:hypothetical protein